MTDDRPRAQPGGHSDAHRGDNEVNLPAILGFGLGLLLVAVIVHFLVWLLFTFFATREARRVAPEFSLAVSEKNRLPPEPRLQTNPRQDLRDLRAQEDAVLTSYGWVDRNNGIVRIPIDQAMKLARERGLPARPLASPAFVATPDDRESPR